MRYLSARTGMRCAIAICLLISTGSALNKLAAGDNLPPGGERTRKENKSAVRAAEQEPRWLRKLLGNDKEKAYAETVRIVLDSPQVANADLVHLRAFTNLTHLILNCSQVTDAGLVHLAGLKELESVTCEQLRMRWVRFVNARKCTRSA